MSIADFVDDVVEGQHLPGRRYDDAVTICQSELTDNTFTLPMGDFDAFSARVFGSEAPEPRLHIAQGTTTLAFHYKGGIVVAVDSRASMGPYVSSQTVQKVIEINSHLLGTMAGGAADCSFWERYLGMQCRLHELRNREKISVAAASKTLCNIVYNYKGMGLSMGTMITGWDKTGPQLYYVDSDGLRVKGDRFCVGSGSTYAYGVLDTHFKWDMTDEEAFELGRKSIYHATHRDAYSGGRVSVYHVHQNGWTKVSRDDVTELHYKYQDAKNKA